jgi:E3 ubiquitin-protein ligase RAD18
MEDLVQAFTKARSDVLEYARKPAVVARSISPKRSREDAGLDDGDGEPRKRTRSSGRRKRKVEIVVEDSVDDDEDYVPGE